VTNIVLVTDGRRPRLLEQTLRTLYERTPSYRFNVTLVTDGMPDHGLPPLVTTHNNSWNVTIWPPCGVIGRLKNLGAYWSEKQFGRGDWLYFSDDDVAFLPGWLEKLTAGAIMLEEFGYELWGGQVHPYHLPIKQAAKGFDIAFGEYQMLDGPSWLMRWRTWDEIGPLPERSGGACQGEDVTFCHRLTAQGGRIGVIHPHVCVHTGLTQSDGNDAPGRKEREAMIPEGVIAE
jgi:hypothetical protein